MGSISQWSLEVESWRETPNYYLIYHNKTIIKIVRLSLATYHMKNENMGKKNHTKKMNTENTHIEKGLEREASRYLIGSCKECREFETLWILFRECAY